MIDETGTIAKRRTLAADSALSGVRDLVAGCPPPAVPSAPGRPWLREIRSRLTAHWVLKAVFIPAFVTVFFVAYFHLLRHPVFPVTLIPQTWLDRMIGFQPAALLPYLSLWVYVLLAPGMLSGRRELLVYAAEAAALTAFGLGAFLLWPTAISPPDLEVANHPLFALLRTVDASGNACPSLHVAFAVFTLIWLARHFLRTGAPMGIQLLNTGWCAAIVYSTLATKQHVVVDVVAGVALGGAAALFDPCDTAMSFNGASSLLNRQSLALAISILGKVTAFALGLDRLHPLTAVLLLVAPDIWVLVGLLMPNASCLIPTATRFETSRREVWLTIDDGPDPSTTGPMLDLLGRHGAKATFFLIGERAVANPVLVAEIVRRGHTIGNHTSTHPLGTFWLAGRRRTAREIDACRDALRSAGVEATDWFRSPAGIKTFFLRSALARRGLILVGWTARGRESWAGSIATPLRRLTTNLRPGAILLIHESDQHGAQRVALLSALLDHLATAGYECVLPPRTALQSRQCGNSSAGTFQAG